MYVKISHCIAEILFFISAHNITAMAKTGTPAVFPSPSVSPGENFCCLKKYSTMLLAILGTTYMTHVYTKLKVLSD